MKNFFKKIKNFFINILLYIKSLFCKASVPNDKVSSNDKQEQINIDSKEEEITEPIITEYDSINNPIDPNNIKKGEIGGYVMYNKETAKITTEFINNLKELGINILYINTPRGKNTTLSFNEWLDLFDKFKDSGIKIMLYIYEAVSVKPKWSTSEIKKISTHPSFYGWIGEDEVSYSSHNGGNAWITRFHNETWSDGSRKWPNIAACYYPKLDNLNSDMIGETYSDYLKLWADSIDVAHADMYPFVSDRTNDSHKNIADDGSPIYSIPEGGYNWFEYLKEHFMFAKEFPNITHRLYMHSCKHVAKDTNGELYIARPKPTELITKIQAYANLMAGSNGLMLFVLNDILSGDAGFSESPFSNTLNINEDTYNTIKNVFTSKEFINYKNIIVNLDKFEFTYGDLGEVIVSFAKNNEYNYITLLNTSLTKDATFEIPSGNLLINLNTLTEQEIKEHEIYTINPGEILFLKSKLN
jgi:hypothetical protein